MAGSVTRFVQNRRCESVAVQLLVSIIHTDVSLEPSPPRTGSGILTNVELAAEHSGRGLDRGPGNVGHAALLDDHVPR